VGDGVVVGAGVVVAVEAGGPKDGMLAAGEEVADGGALDGPFGGDITATDEPLDWSRTVERMPPVAANPTGEPVDGG
jgi:hypothetical protein